jgi:phage terminase large subunit
MKGTSGIGADVIGGPVWFAEEILKLKLYGWQDEVLSWFENTHSRTKGSVVAPNGSGKSERCVASLALWWLAVHRRGIVVITSKDSRQLDEQIWTALEAHKAKFKGWKFQDRYIESATGGRVIAFTTDEPGRAEGWHKGDDIDAPLLIICDEAKSIAEGIFTAFDRCTFNGLLYISSGGLMLGRFYDSHTKNRAQYRTRKVSLEECPHIPKQKIRDIIEQYGAEHPFTRSAVFGEFMEQDANTRFCFSLADVQAAISDPPAFRSGEHLAFCDFAAGGDENVIAQRMGNKVLPLICWREKDTMASVGRFIVEFRKAGLKPENIYGDEGGMGKVMCDALRDAGWDIHRVNNGAAALDDRHLNRGGEMWHASGHKVRRGELILPNDDLLVAQLTTRPARISREGRLGVMSKEDMRKAPLCLPSPDRADAVCGVCAVTSLMAMPQGKSIVGSWREELANRESEEAEALIGCDAGY